MIKINVQAVQLADMEIKGGNAKLEGKKDSKTGAAFTSLLNLLAQGNEGKLQEFAAGNGQGNSEGNDSEFKNLNIVTMLDSLFATQSLEGVQNEDVIDNPKLIKILEVLGSEDFVKLLDKLNLNGEEKEVFNILSDKVRETLKNIDLNENAVFIKELLLQNFQKAVGSSGEKSEVNFGQLLANIDNRIEQNENLTGNEKAELRKVFRVIKEILSLQKQQISEKQQLRQENFNLRSGEDKSKNNVFTRELGTNPKNTSIGERNSGSVQKVGKNSNNNFTTLQQQSLRQSNGNPAVENSSESGSKSQTVNRNQSIPAQIQKLINNSYTSMQKQSYVQNEGNAGSQAQSRSSAAMASGRPLVEGNVSNKGTDAKLNTLNSEVQAKTINSATESSGSRQEGFGGNQQGFLGNAKTATINLQGQAGNNKLPQAAQMAAKMAPVIQQAVSGGQGHGTTTLHIKLKPESLGEVTVRVTYNQGNVQAHFIAASAQTREMLDQSMAQLRENLSQMNINLSDASTSSTGQEGQKWHEQFGGRKSNPAPDGDSFFPGENEEDELSEEEPGFEDNGLNYLI